MKEVGVLNIEYYMKLLLKDGYIIGKFEVFAHQSIRDMRLLSSACFAQRELPAAERGFINFRVGFFCFGELCKNTDIYCP